MEEKKINLNDLGNDFDIQESDEKSNFEIIYSGKVDSGGYGGGPPPLYKSFWFAISFFIITITVLLISGAIWGYGYQDWGPFKIIGNFVCELMKAIRIRG